MARWKVEIAGDPSYMTEFRTLLTDANADVSFEEVGGKFYIFGERFKSFTKPSDVRTEAEELINRLRTALQFLPQQQQNRLPWVVSVVCEKDDGTICQHVQASATLSIEWRTAEPASPAQAQAAREFKKKCLRLCVNDEKVWRVLDCFKYQEPRYDRLWHAYEIIERNLGGEQQLRQKLGIERRQLNRLRTNINHPNLGGELARHAVCKQGDRTPSPEMKMSPSEVCAEVRSIVRKWIEKEKG